MGDLGIGSIAGPIAGIGQAVGGKGAASASAKALENAAQTAANTTLAMYNQNRTDLSPFRNLGYGALGTISNLYGLPFGGFTDPTTGLTVPASAGGPSQDFYTTQMPGYTSSLNNLIAPFSGPIDPTSGYSTGLTNILRNFRGSPDYQFASKQGLLKTGQALNAQGWGGGGGMGRGLADYSSGLATQNYQNYLGNVLNAANTGINQVSNVAALGGNTFNQYFNRLASLAGIGQSAAGQTANLGANAAQNIATNQLQSGTAQAAGITGGYNALNQGLNTALAYGTMPQYSSGTSYTGAGGTGFGYNPDNASLIASSVA